MPTDLKAAVMNALSQRLTINMSSLSEVLEAQPEDVEKALHDLEGKQLVNLAKDSVTGDVLISPTSLGILQTRRLMKSSA